MTEKDKDLGALLTKYAIISMQAGLSENRQTKERREEMRSLINDTYNQIMIRLPYQKYGITREQIDTLMRLIGNYGQYCEMEAYTRMSWDKDLYNKKLQDANERARRKTLLTLTRIKNLLKEAT